MKYIKICHLKKYLFNFCLNDFDIVWNKKILYIRDKEELLLKNKNTHNISRYSSLDSFMKWSKAYYPRERVRRENSSFKTKDRLFKKAKSLDLEIVNIEKCSLNRGYLVIRNKKLNVYKRMKISTFLYQDWSFSGPAIEELEIRRILNKNDCLLIKYNHQNKIVKFKTLKDKKVFNKKFQGIKRFSDYILKINNNIPKNKKSYYGSKAEGRIASILLYNQIPFISQYYAKGEKFEHLFDFFIPDKKIMIEYDGLQHFKEIKFWGGKKGFLDRIKRDKEKNDWCITNGIALFRINYEKETVNEIFKTLKNIEPSLVKPPDGYSAKNLITEKNIAFFYNNHTLKETKNFYGIADVTVFKAYKNVFGKTKSEKKVGFKKDYQYKSTIANFYLENDAQTTAENFKITKARVYAIFFDVFHISKREFLKGNKTHIYRKKKSDIVIRRIKDHKKFNFNTYREASLFIFGYVSGDVSACGRGERQTVGGYIIENKKK